jgi:regulator of replication initiation timing
MIDVESINTLQEAKATIYTLIEYIKKLESKIAALEVAVSELKKENAVLKEENLQLKQEIKRLRGDDPDPNTPSGMIPTFKKQNKKEKHSKPGRKNGHEGSRREQPKATAFINHELKQCPDCGCCLCKSQGKRKRIIEDIAISKPEVTEHTINRYYCPRCKKPVEPLITCALPHSQLGNRFLVTTAWLHFCLGMTVGNIVKWLDAIGGLKITAGGLTQMWQRLAMYLGPMYDEIGNEVRGSPVAHADETGWRLNGKTVWLWCFTTSKSAYYRIEPSRGSNVVTDVLGNVFSGILVTDFYAAYNRINAWTKQKCLVHLFRELKNTSIKNKSEEFHMFAKKLKKILKDAIKLMKKRLELNEDDYDRLKGKIYYRYASILCESYCDCDVIRLVKRLVKYSDNMFTFLEETGVPFNNNHAERMIRPAVIMRKNSFCNRSESGAQTQEILMSVFKTLALKNIEPVNYVVEYLENSIQNNHYQRTERLAA